MAPRLVALPGGRELVAPARRARLEVPAPRTGEEVGHGAGTWVRAAQDASSAVAAAVVELRAVRVDLLAGHHGSAAQRSAALGDHLAAVAAVLEEMTAGLDALAREDDEGPGGIA